MLLSVGALWSQITDKYLQHEYINVTNTYLKHDYILSTNTLSHVSFQINSPINLPFVGIQYYVFKTYGYN